MNNAQAVVATYKEYAECVYEGIGPNPSLWEFTGILNALIPYGETLKKNAIRVRGDKRIFYAPDQQKIIRDAARQLHDWKDSKRWRVVLLMENGATMYLDSHDLCGAVADGHGIRKDYPGVRNLILCPRFDGDRIKAWLKKQF